MATAATTPMATMRGGDEKLREIEDRHAAKNPTSTARKRGTTRSFATRRNVRNGSSKRCQHDSAQEDCQNGGRPPSDASRQ